MYGRSTSWQPRPPTARHALTARARTLTGITPPPGGIDDAPPLLAAQAVHRTPRRSRPASSVPATTPASARDRIVDAAGTSRATPAAAGTDYHP